jgi:hypothetical protein
VTNIVSFFKIKLITGPSFPIEDNGLLDDDDGDEVDLTGCVEKPEFTFNNGAKFKGQWKNEMRHGLGT